MDPAIAGRDYDTASNMMVNGEALFFIMGDWELGAIKSVGHEPGGDILCGQSPTDWAGDGFILNSDSVVFFQQNDAGVSGRPEAPRPPHPEPGIPVGVQHHQGLDPGSPRCRPVAGLQRLPAAEPGSSFRLRSTAGTLVRSMAHNMTVLQKYRGAMMDTITEFVNAPEMTSEEAANTMADAVEAQM